MVVVLLEVWVHQRFDLRMANVLSRGGLVPYPALALGQGWGLGRATVPGGGPLGLDFRGFEDLGAMVALWTSIPLEKWPV